MSAIYSETVRTRVEATPVDPGKLNKRLQETQCRSAKRAIVLNSIQDRGVVPFNHLAAPAKGLLDQLVREGAATIVHWNLDRHYAGLNPSPISLNYN